MSEIHFYFSLTLVVVTVLLLNLMFYIKSRFDHQDDMLQTLYEILSCEFGDVE